MRNLTNLLQGIVSVGISGPFPERLLNLCAQERVAFWALVWKDETSLTMEIHRSSLKKLRLLAQRVGCYVEEGKSRGLPVFLERFRRRYAFLAGLALSLLAVCLLSRVVLTIQVTGNQSVPSAPILSELRRLGLRPGVYGPGLDLKHIAQEALLELEDLSWMTVNLYGTRAEVIVREVVPPPELVEEDGCYDIVALADGLITEVETLKGEALVREGDTVLAGDILITGNVSVEPPQYSDLPVRHYQVHARGKVVARTWRTMTARIPLTAQVKTYTGEEKNRYALTVFGHSTEFYRNSSISWPLYDKITTVYPLALPGKVTLPVNWTVHCLRQYELEEKPVDPEAAQTLLEQELETRLLQTLGEKGTVEEISFTAQIRDQWLNVTLRAQCQEEIGREIPADYGPDDDFAQISGAAP